MVLSEKVPSIAIATHAFGRASISTLIKSYLFKTAEALGVQADDESVALITQDIIEGFSDLKITEIMLALALMRQAYFRDKNEKEDAGKNYGSLSSEVICNALWRYRKEVRNPILEKSEDEKRKQEREESEHHKATYEEKREVLANKCLKEPEFLDLIKQNHWLKENDIMAIENAIKELEGLRLFYKVGKEFVEKVDAGADPKASMERLRNGINYIDTHFNTKQNESHDN